MPVIGRFGRPGLLGLAARTAVVAGTATAVSGGVAARQQRRAAEHAAAQAAAQPVAAPMPLPAPVAGEDPLTGRLQQLAALHAQGILTDEEFATAKARALGL